MNSIQKLKKEKSKKIIIQILNTLMLCGGLILSVKILFDIDDCQMKLKNLKGYK